jgi:mannose-6-phosphate isomerase-like protein (cupin superfamily)
VQPITLATYEPADNPPKQVIEVPMLEQADRQIDNARTRVTRHRMAPGAHTGFHRHEYDYVIVPVTSGRMRILEAGKELYADLESGVAYFRLAGVEHDIFNDGRQELVFVEVELMG